MKKTIYKILMHLEEKLGEAKTYYNSRKAVLGKDSFIHREAQVVNMRNNINDIEIGSNSHIRGELLTFNYGGKIHIGDNSYVGIGTRIWSGESIKIGSNVLISHNVNIFDTDSHEVEHLERAEGYMNLLKHKHPKIKGSIKTKPVVIEDHAWISFNAIILKGVKIGKGAIVAAGSVVTKDVPEFTVVAGNPAEVVRKLN